MSLTICVQIDQMWLGAFILSSTEPKKGSWEAYSMVLVPGSVHSPVLKAHKVSFWYGSRTVVHLWDGGKVALFSAMSDKNSMGESF